MSSFRLRDGGHLPDVNDPTAPFRDGRWIDRTHPSARGMGEAEFKGHLSLLAYYLGTKLRTDNKIFFELFAQ